MKYLLLAGLVGLGLSASAQAALVTLAENTHPPNGGGGNNTYSLVASVGAENFSLAGTYDILQISHVGHRERNFPQPTSIDWGIYADSAGRPGAVIASGDAASFSSSVEGTAGFTIDVTRYSIATSGVTLGPGDYWVGFHNNTEFANPNWTFASGGTSFDNLSAVSTDGGLNWSNNYPGGNMTFRVEGMIATAVPEPSSLVLLGIGALAMVCLRVHRKQRAA